MRLGELGGLLDLIVGRLRPADADVLGNAAVEQSGVLEHHGNGAAQRGEPDVADVVPVDE